MNSYFFLGFHIYKDFNVTFMYQKIQIEVLIKLQNLAFMSYFPDYKKYWKVFKRDIFSILFI